jgi:hypothetical protein
MVIKNIILVAIGGYWWLNYHRLLVAIGDYFINGYFWLFHYKPLVVILLFIIDGYFISSY